MPSCDCILGQSRCREADGYWSAANSIYYSQGYEAWMKALEPYNEHIHRVQIETLLDEGASELADQLIQDVERHA